MTTTDEALTEQIAQVLDPDAWVEDDGSGVINEHHFRKIAAREVAAAVLPIIRKAQADALRDAADTLPAYPTTRHTLRLLLHDRAALIDQESR